MKLFKPSRRKGQILYWAMMAALACIFVVSAVMVGRHYYQAQKSAQQFQNLTQLPQEVDPVTEQAAAERYAPLVQRNGDFFGWLHIDGTNIDYPVVITPDDPEYYLRRGFDKKYSYYGTPFAEEDCTPKSDNIIVYGHNMNNGTMFADLQKYASYQFYEKHALVKFDTLEGFGTYRIFAVFYTQAGAEDEFEYYRFVNGSQNDYDQYVQTCKELSIYEVKVTPQYGQQLLTLSTCEYSRTNGRLVVVAVKED